MTTKKIEEEMISMNERRCNYDRALGEEYFDPTAPLGEARRYRHDTPDCSKGKDSCLIVTRTDSGWKYYCHRCGLRGVHGLDGLPPDKIQRWYKTRKDVPRQTEQVVSLPQDFSRDLTRFPKGYAWLMSLGISDEQIKKYQIGFSPYYNRLIFPVYMGGKLVFWQGRTFHTVTKSNPKWLSVRVPRNQDIFFLAAGPAESQHIVLVEDILSALKVSNVDHSVALLGVYIPEALMWRIKKAGLGAVIWLDQDKTDRSLYYSHRFRSAGIPTRVRSTSLDPKKYNVQKIKEILCHG